MPQTTIYPRYIKPRLAEALEDSPVILIHGPRQCGKTTLAQTVCAPSQLKWSGDTLIGFLSGQARDYEYVSFDDDNARAGAQYDPMGFVSDLPERVILDEVQRVPELFTALKLEVDRRRITDCQTIQPRRPFLSVPSVTADYRGLCDSS